MYQHTDEHRGKGSTPKGYADWLYILGHEANRFMTVIERWSAIRKNTADISGFVGRPFGALFL